MIIKNSPTIVFMPGMLLRTSLRCTFRLAILSPAIYLNFFKRKFMPQKFLPSSFAKDIYFR